MNKWYNIELEKKHVDRFKEYLTNQNITFETSGAYNLTHFEIYATKKQAETIDAWLNLCLFKEIA